MERKAEPGGTWKFWWPMAQSTPLDTESPCDNYRKFEIFVCGDCCLPDSSAPARGVSSVAWLDLRKVRAPGLATVYQMVSWMQRFALRSAEGPAVRSVYSAGVHGVFV